MYKHILLPTDGSELSQQAVISGILFEKSIGASVVILKTAEQTHCDLVYMASHGWHGDEAQLLGSVTLKVLHHSTIPVLVHKPEHHRTRTGNE